jgi:hypothetical protein
LQFSIYINHLFSKELKLLISLSQNEIDFDPNNKILSEINWDTFLHLVLKHRLVSHVLKHSDKLTNKIPQEIVVKLKEIKLNQSKISLEYTSFLIKIANQFKSN